jgi:hypothetical protein
MPGATVFIEYILSSKWHKSHLFQLYLFVRNSLFVSISAHAYSVIIFWAVEQARK